MDSGKKKRLEWESGITVVALGVIVGLVIILLVRFTDLPERPWSYIGIAVAMLSAVAALVLAVVRAFDVTN
ncbi:MAG: hypothetical protein ACRDOT_04360 [Aeromicrobium sp.]